MRSGAALMIEVTIYPMSRDSCKALVGKESICF